MDFPTFDAFQESLISEVMVMRDTKGKEYANSVDRFANFRRLADQLGLKDYQVAWIYCAKHLDSIASYMKAGKTFSTEPIRGRFVDAITYLTLLAGMVEEQGSGKMTERLWGWRNNAGRERRHLSEAYC